MKITRLLFFVLLFISFVKAYAQAPVFEQNKGEDMSAYNQALDTVQDALYETLINPSSGWRNDYINYEAQDFVRLFVDDEYTAPVSKFSYMFLVKVTRWDVNGTQTNFNVSIPLSYDPEQYKPYRDISVYRFTGAHKFTCNILSVTDAGTGGSVSFGSLKRKFVLRQEIRADRYEKSSYDEVVSSTDLTHSFTPGKIRIDWSPVVAKSPTEFELEWIHVDDYGGNYTDFLRDYPVLLHDFEDEGSTYGWEPVDFTIADGKMNINDEQHIYRPFTTVPQQTFKITLTVSSLTNGKELTVTAYDSASFSALGQLLITAPGTYDLEFEAVKQSFALGLDNEDEASCSIEEVGFQNITYEPASGQPYYKPAEKLTYNFKNNATRVRVSDNNYTIEDVFERGYLLYRVRRVRLDSIYRKYEKFSPWSDTSQSGMVADYADTAVTGAHESDSLNWNYQVSYAEDGKRKDMVGYYDGLLKPRQQVAISNSDHTAIVGESKYDYTGRPAIQILPVPALKQDTGYYDRLRYYDAFNRNASGQPYSALDFDSLEAACILKTADSLSVSSGASRYYSGNNPNKADFQKYVPDAQGYPMVQTEYMPDNTGRVRRQGGVGADHQLGTGHETFYEYSQPGQAELDRLFGSETGMASHYKKQTVTDANGQVSVSYTDMTGRVVATALSGPSPANLQALPENRPASFMVNSIKDNNVMSANGIELSYEHTVSEEGPIYIDYRMLSSSFNKGCAEICFQCVYNYELTLFNKSCNQVIFSFKDTLGFLNPLDTLCESIASVNILDHLGDLQALESSIDTLHNLIMIPGLDKGTYALTKRLYVNPGASALYFERYRNQSECVRSFESFYQQALDSTDFSGCDPCDTCGQGDAYGYCDAMLEQMKSDVSPGGQYCTYEHDENGNIKLIDNDTMTSVMRVTRYKTIKAYSTNDSLDKILLADGTIDSAYKADVHHFITYFKSSWADSLVKFHPEYPFYLYCKNFLSESYAYDAEQNAMTSYDTAFKYGYLNPTGISGLKMGFPTDTTGRDPYFHANPTLKTTMNTRMLNFRTVNDTVYSIWDMAAMQTFCSPITDPYEQYACLQAFRDRRVVDSLFFSKADRAEFMQAFYGMYSSLKQEIINENIEDALTLYTNITPGITYPNCYVGETGCGDYATKIRRYYTGYSDGLNRSAGDAAVGEEMKERIGDELGQDSTCYNAALKWLEELQACPYRPAAATTAYTAMKDSLILLCQRGRLASNPPSLFPVTSLPAHYNVGFRSMQQLLNYFYGEDSTAAINQIGCSSSLLSNSYNYTHSFTQSQADAECQCLKNNVIIPKQVEIHDSVPNSMEGRCIRSVKTLDSTGLGIRQLMDSILHRGAALKTGVSFWDTGYMAYKTYLKPHKFKYEIVGSNEVIQNYPGALASRSVHQWRINFSDSLYPEERCNVFFNINSDIAAYLFSGHAKIIGFEYVSRDTFMVIAGSDDVANPYRFTGFSNCLRMFRDSCIESTTDTLYGSPFRVDSTEYDSFMVMARAIRNGTADSLMAEYMSGGDCEDELSLPSCVTPVNTRTLDLIDVMNEALYVGRLEPGAFDNISINKPEYWIGTHDGNSIDNRGWYNYTMDELSPTYVQKFALDWSRYDGYQSFTFPSNDQDEPYCLDDQNKLSDPYFMGVSVFGILYGENIPIENCRLSYGDPLRSGIEIADIDSFIDFRYDPLYNSFVVTALIFDTIYRSHILPWKRTMRIIQRPHLLTVRSCFDGGMCGDYANGSTPGSFKRTYIEEDRDYNFQYNFECEDLERYYKGIRDYTCDNADIRDLLLDSGYTPMFLENVLNEKAKATHYTNLNGNWVYVNTLVSVNPDYTGNPYQNVDDFFSIAGLPSAIAGITGGNRYNMDYLTDSFMIMHLGDTGLLTGCQLTLKLIDGDGEFDFGLVDSFYQLRPDEDKLREYFLAGDFDKGRHYFTIMAWDNDSGFAYKLRGWLSCVPVFNCIVPASGNLAYSKDNRCGCSTCPEVKQVVDSFMVLYNNPAINVATTQKAMTGFLNNNLNNNLTWNEYESFMAGCHLFDRQEQQVTYCDYWVKADFDSISFLTLNNFLNSINNEKGYLITYKSMATISLDSAEFCFNLSDLPESEKTKYTNKLDSFFKARFFSYRSMMQPVSACGITIDAFSQSGCFGILGNKIDSLVCMRFGLTMPGAGYFRMLKNTYVASDTLYRWCLDLSAKSITEKQAIYDVVDSLLEHCSQVSYYTNFSTRKGHGRVSADSMTIRQLDTNYLTVKGDVCESCTDIYDKLLKYQQQVYETKPELVREAALPEQGERHLRNWYGYDVQISETQPESTGGEKQTQVCAPTSKAYDLLGLMRMLHREDNFFDNDIINLGHDTFASLIDTNGADAFYELLDFDESDTLRVVLTFSISQGEKICKYTMAGSMQMLAMDTLMGISSYPGNSSMALLVAGSAGWLNTYTISSDCDGLSNCCTFVMPKLCFRSNFEVMPLDTGACRRQLTEIARSNAMEAYREYTDSLKLAFADEYNGFCLDNAVENEQIGVGYHFAEYHYTLYYYDLAGNLLKTVPPAGVDTLDISPELTETLNSNRKTYEAGTHVHTAHTLATNYRYNSLGQVRWQKTPDAGESRFYYDLLGRLVVSQNSRQAAQGNVYSYTVRDVLNRVTEVGQISSTAIHEDSLKFHYNIYYPAWLARGYKTQITKTYYDNTYSTTINNLFTYGQQYLRSRVATVAYYEYNVSNYSYATHYSYDLHGNVDVLVQDYPELQGMGNRYKYIHYHYDLVSGKVNMVRYQPGQPDRFYHKYVYDADNRLRSVHTSSDSVVWDDDAAYKYYRHGPLARMELGGKNVQGVDYAYTIHGWLKGVNSNTLDSTRDMGQDGFGNMAFAADAYGFTLGYYNGDYKPIDNSYYNTATAFVANITADPFLNANHLYNGNISHMVQAVRPLMTANQPMANIYRYDQLNRITEMTTKTDVNVAGNIWEGIADIESDYMNTFSYDPNGNIKTQVRYGAGTSKIDELTYSYYPGTNRLKRVNDVVNPGDYPDDIDDQTGDNYQYDAIGNLAKDVAEEIDTIQWNVYGKLRHIKRSESSTKPGLEFKYDASGQRAVKIVKAGASENTWTKQYYVRDAQGNVMATYNSKSYVANDDLNIAAITDWIIDSLGTDSLIKLMQDNYSSNSEFKALLIDRLVINGAGFNVLDNYDLSEILGWDNTLANIVVSYMNDNDVTVQQAFLSGLIYYDKAQFMTNLQSCSGVNQPNVISAFFHNNDVLYNTLKYMCDNGMTDLLEPTCISLGITYQVCDPFPPFDCFPVSCEELAANMRDYYDRNALISSLMMINGYSAMVDNINNSNSESEIIAALDPAGILDGVSFFTGLAGCLELTMLNDYLTGSYSYQHLAKVSIISHLSHAFLLNLAMDDDSELLIQHAINESLLSLNETLAGLSGFDITTYMNLVKLRWGQQAYESLASNLIYTQQLKLAEHHLYGSSRFGVRYADTTLFQRDITINGFDSLGQIIVDDVLDSIKLHIDTTQFYYMLAQKQYELTNHLGNVLATVSDRKTPVGSGVDYFKADVINANYYYPFGSSLKSWQSDTTYKYKYQFNRKEIDKEGLGGGGWTYDYGFRIYNAQLGKFLSVDPLCSAFPWWTPYQFAGNTPIFAIDADGLEIRNAYYEYSNNGEKLALKNPNEQYLADRVDEAIELLRKDDKALYNFLNKNDVEVNANSLPSNTSGNYTIHQLGNTEMKYDYVTLTAQQAYDLEHGEGAFEQLGIDDFEAVKKYIEEYKTHEKVVGKWKTVITIDVRKIDDLNKKALLGEPGYRQTGVGRVMKHEAAHFLYNIKHAYDYVKNIWKKGWEALSEKFAKDRENEYDGKEETETPID
ncbi:RHS repeat-associated core domain-containing protein [Pedobacter insulae]|uniref:Uncharacterized conserved protein RhaS, contains 28 RHS repeats n=1 Tax=Pedobacter insulae TaxID=414048 RepID=A0A1I2ZH95_9SPHI|nr:RHS repeat-associated core domain-containing protein [Pedobacter insulae]SFH37188.1 Uncharacterized conserved protein RhaS, contains 28 RHS repeats [Pedobacter insulae]